LADGVTVTVVVVAEPVVPEPAGSHGTADRDATLPHAGRPFAVVRGRATAGRAAGGGAGACSTFGTVSTGVGGGVGSACSHPPASATTANSTRVFIG
jgi:hypothetical protein